MSHSTGSAPSASRSAACSGLADQAAGTVAARGEQAQELERDLAVASGDYDIHRLAGYRRRHSWLRRRAGG